MESGGVTTPLSVKTGGGGGDNRLAPDSRYETVNEMLIDLCAWYMSIGMSRDEYWNGEATAVIDYRKAHEMKLREENRLMHHFGAYVYQALLAVSPAYNFWSKRRDPMPYPTETIPILESEAKEREAEKKRSAMNKLFNRLAKLTG